MTEEQCLLAAILSTPADDCARLVYADWLDDHATKKRAARAELIRLQVRLANPPPVLEAGDASDWHGESTVLRRREQAILKKYAAGWLPKAARRRLTVARVEVDGPKVSTDMFHFGHGYEFEFRRGFIERVAVGRSSEPELLANLPPIGEFLADHPLARVLLTVTGHSPAVVIGIAPSPIIPFWHLTVDAGDAERGEDAERVYAFTHGSRATLVKRINGQAEFAIKESIDFGRTPGGDYPYDEGDPSDQAEQEQRDDHDQYGTAFW